MEFERKVREDEDEKEREREREGEARSFNTTSRECFTQPDLDQIHSVNPSLSINRSGVFEETLEAQKLAMRSLLPSGDYLTSQAVTFYSHHLEEETPEE